MLELDAEVI